MRACAARIILALAVAGVPSATFARPGADARALIGPAEFTDSAGRDPLAPLDEGSQGTELSSPDAARVTNWVIATGDNGGVPFIVIDKIAAMVFVFDATGQLVGSSAALLGITPGDDTAPGIGDRELREIAVEDRTTPAGRFVAKFGHAAGNGNVLWVDYASALSIHAVVSGVRKEHRLQRLKSPTPQDNRITYGCINVPAKFYANIVRPVFKDTTGVVYILPETRPLKEVFLAI
jgi:hypothetical protein